MHRTKWKALGLLVIQVLFLASASTQPESTGVGRWSYADGAFGPESWQTVTREGSSALAFPGCATAARPQSPVVLEATAEPDLQLEAIDFSAFGAPGAKANVTNDGRVLSLVASGTVATTTWRGQLYALVTAELHVPGEHALAWGRHDMEVHLVLAATDSANAAATVAAATSWLIVVTVWRAAAFGTHDVLQRLFVDTPVPTAPVRTSAVPPLVPSVNSSEALHDVSWRSFVPSARSYYTYQGSWSHPPCAPAQVVVFEQPLVASIAQVEAVHRALSGPLVPAGNARPIPESRTPAVVTRYIDGSSGGSDGSAGQRADRYDAAMLSVGRVQLGVPIAALVMGGLCIIALVALLAFGPAPKPPTHGSDSGTAVRSRTADM